MPGGTLYNCVSNYGEYQALVYLASISPYLALYSVLPTQSTAGTEIASGSYARKAVTWNTPVLNSAGNFQMTNAANITFPNPTAGYTAVAWATCTASSSGNQTAIGQLMNSVGLPMSVTVVNGGTPIVIPAQGIVIALQ